MNRILSTKVQSRKELIEVVKEYRSAVERAKSQQSLKNYHRRFREQLKSKLSKTHEKQCEKISNTISQSLYSLHSFNIWPLLYSQRGSNLALSIPPTLYHDSKLEFFAFSHEHLEFFTGPNIYESFIQGLQIEASLPICVFKPLDGKLKLISTISTLRNYFRNKDSICGYFQYYMPPTSQCTSILLSYYRKGAPIKSFIIQNNSQVPYREKTHQEEPKLVIDSHPTDKILRTMLREFKINKNESKLKRKLTFDFNHSANNSAFISEQVSIIESKPNNFTNLAQRIKSLEAHDEFINTESFQLFLDNNAKKFVVDLANTRFLTPYNLKVFEPGVKNMVKTVFALTESFIKKNMAKDLNEITLSFIRNYKKKWVLLKVNALKYAQPYNFEECSLNGESLDENSFHMSFLDNSRILNTTFIPVVVENAKRKASIIKPVIKIRHLEDIKAKSSVKFVKKRKSLGITEKVQKCLEDACKNLDFMRRNVRMSKKNFINLADKYSASTFWKELTVKIYKTMLATHLAKYFSNTTADKFYAMSDAMFKVLTSDIGPNFLRKISQAHRNLHITNEDFEEYKLIFINNLKLYIFDKSDIEIVEINLDSLKNSLTCTDSLTFSY